MLNKVLFVIFLTILTACSTTPKKEDIYGKLSDKEIYARAENHLQEKNYREAIKYLEALEAYYPYGDYTEKGQLAIIRTYYKQQEYAASLAAADRFLKMHPRHAHADEVYYLKGLVNYEQDLKFLMRHLHLERSARDPSSAQASIQIFTALITQFPHSPYATQAKERIQSLRNHLAKYEFQVAEYYFTRRAYAAAIQRANTIIKHYKDTEVAPKTLQLMIKAYNLLNMPALAKETEKHLASILNQDKAK